jgi:hypothetical protein
LSAGQIAVIGKATVAFKKWRRRVHMSVCL